MTYAQSNCRVFMNWLRKLKSLKNKLIFSKQLRQLAAIIYNSSDRPQLGNWSDVRRVRRTS